MSALLPSLEHELAGAARRARHGIAVRHSAACLLCAALTLAVVPAAAL